MSQSLTFMMGQYTAEFPVDFEYASNHMWAKRIEADPAGRCRFGFSNYAVRLLQDVYFLDWTVDTGTQLNHRQEIGSIESKKAESSLYSPAAGKLLQFNDALLSDPSYINVDNHGAGWLFEMQLTKADLMSVEAYIEHLHTVWEVTQRTIKGQLG